MPDRAENRFPFLLLALAALSVAASGDSTPYPRLKIFARVLAHIEASYVEPVDANKLVDGAIEGMVKKLDPHSEYYRPEDFKHIFEDTEGEFGGIGIEVDILNDLMTVIAPLPHSPAEQAGVRAGDVIVRIEGKSTREMSLEEAVRLMRGEPGTEVSLTLRRPKDNAGFDLKLKRDRIKFESVESMPLGAGFGLVKVRVFQRDTPQRVQEEMKKLSAKGRIQGLVLDLRHNPGGMFDAAVKVADLFLPNGVIVTTRGRNNQVMKTYSATRDSDDADFPMALVVDQGSASASEIVAGALQDLGRAVVVGTNTFGKGSVQTLIELEDGSGLKLTVARYYTPNGRSIQAEGIVPDIRIEGDDVKALGLPGHSKEADLEGHLRPETNGTSKSDLVTDIDDVQIRVAFDLVRALARERQAK